MESLLLDNGISVCHPAPANIMKAKRNKEIFEEDLKMGYHPRGSCKNEGGCVIYQLFGDLDKAGLLIIPSIMFYPASTLGNIARNHQKLFKNMGTGRLEVVHNSPRSRSQDKPFLTVESCVGVCIEAPWKIVIRSNNELYKILLVKTFQYIKEKVENSEFEYFFGGKRGAGYGGAYIVFLNEEGNYLQRNRDSIGLKKEESEEMEQKFHVFLKAEREKFPMDKIGEN